MTESRAALAIICSHEYNTPRFTRSFQTNIYNHNRSGFCCRGKTGSGQLQVCTRPFHTRNIVIHAAHPPSAEDGAAGQERALKHPARGPVCCLGRTHKWCLGRNHKCHSTASSLLGPALPQLFTPVLRPRARRDHGVVTFVFMIHAIYLPVVRSGATPPPPPTAAWSK